MDHDIYSKENRNKFIENNKDFIYETTSFFCNQELDWIVDQELNIALFAFNKACETYNEIEGSFLNYAYILIKSALIEYYIKLEESPLLIFEYGNKIHSDLLNTLSDFEIFFDNKERAKEIALLTEELTKHSITYKNIVKLKLKDPSLKNKILNLVIAISRKSDLKEDILINKSFDIDQLSNLCDLDKETLTKYKKYIIMLLLVISSDKYIYLKGSLDIKVGASNA